MKGYLLAVLIGGSLAVAAVYAFLLAYSHML